jgi:alginate O-acetyltransferase complex protein AlgI
MFLLAASCYFYMALIPLYIFVLAAAIVIDYTAAIFIEKESNGKKRKLYLIISIVSTCLLLFVFKYFNFFIGNYNALAKSLDWNYTTTLLEIVLPVGLSFHTFQSLSYVIEVYHGRQKAERHFGIYSLYVMFYPQLVAGPIERPQNMLHQFRIKQKFDHARAVSGMRLILWGLFKKIVIADRLSVYVNQVYNHPNDYQGWPIIIASFFFAYQIYCDFSGYSDIAIGTARVMGFELMENFKTPYYSKSIREFWSRWHISLSSWFRDYVYIPLGGNRTTKWKWYYNLFITFLISGFWHGANWTFVAWGVLHGLYLIAGLMINQFIIHKSKGLTQFFTNNIAGKLVLWLKTFLLVVFAWVFFRANSIEDAFTLIQNSVHINAATSNYHLAGMEWENLKFEYTLAFVFIAFMEIIQLISWNRKIENSINVWPTIIRWVFYFLIVQLIIWFGYYGGDAKFIYFQF